MERREYVFCEYCQKEVLSNDAWELDSLPCCEKCWAKRFDPPQHKQDRKQIPKSR